MAISKKKSVDLTKRSSGKTASRKQAPKKSAKVATSPGPKAMEQSIATVVRGAMLGLQTAHKASERPPLAFRVSAFPFCPLLGALSPLEDNDVYRNHFYFDMGTAMHTLLQTWMARSINGVKMWGDWECGCDRSKNKKDSKTGKRMSTHSATHTCKPGEKCPGGKEWFYKEVELVYKNLTGHVDLILKVPGGYRNGKRQKPWFIVVDFKSTNLLKWDGKKKVWRKMTEEELDDKYPIPANVVQISSYCALLTEVLGLNIQGWGLVYVDRSRPLQRDDDMRIVSKSWTPTKQERWLKRMDDACLASHSALKAVALRVGGKSVPDKLLKDMVAKRPCRVAKDHDSYMAAEFYYEDNKECEHKGICCSGAGSDRHVTSLFRKLLDDSHAFRSRDQRNVSI